MKLETIIAICSGLVLPISASTLGYVISIERRVTTLEVKDEMRARGAVQPPAAIASPNIRT